MVWYPLSILQYERLYCPWCPVSTWNSSKIYLTNSATFYSHLLAHESSTLTVRDRAASAFVSGTEGWKSTSPPIKSYTALTTTRHYSVIFSKEAAYCHERNDAEMGPANLLLASAEDASLLLKIQPIILTCLQIHYQFLSPRNSPQLCTS